MNSLKIAGHRGTWYVIDTETIDGKTYWLLESEQYGEDAFHLIVLADTLEVVLDEVCSGMLELHEFLGGEQ